MNFRKARVGDKQALLDLFTQLTKKTPLDIDEIFSNMRKVDNAFVLEVDGQVAGFGALVVYTTPLHGFVGRIEDVVVDNKYRGKRLGFKLVEHLLDTARKLNLNSVNLTSKPERVAAQKIYLSLGFERVDTDYFRILLK